MANNKMVHKEIVVGDYVLTPCKNAFNDNVSYWISKKGNFTAKYAFTPMDAQDLKDQTSKDALETHIAFFKSAVEYSRAV